MNDKLLALDFLIVFTLLAHFGSCSFICGDTIPFKLFELHYYHSAPSVCVYKIIPSNSRVRQLRIDLTMKLAQPTFHVNEFTTLPSCERDSVEIEDLIFCGNEWDQHVYIPFPNRTNPVITITIHTANRSNDEPRSGWHLRVTQIELNPSCENGLSKKCEENISLAPPGCLQYFTELRGGIHSFNYKGLPASYPADLKYKMCVQKRPPYNALSLYFHNFDLRGYIAEGSERRLNSTFCESQPTLDNLMIPQSALLSTEFSGFQDNKFCGKSLQYRRLAIKEDPSLDYFWMLFEPKSYIAQNSTGFKLSYWLDNA